MLNKTMTIEERLETDIANSYEVPNNVLKAVPKPLVSVRTSAYQHGPYIKQCIESIVKQKTKFKFEFIIGEDFSTDGTREIVLEYAKKYPDIIRVITADYNVGMRANGFRCIRAMRGKYIAICEGDDYWTDAQKLQKQVDFMEKHQDYALCFHPVRVIFENGEKEDTIFPNMTKGFTVKKLLEENYIQTNSVLYKKQEYKDYPIDIMPGDWYMHLYHAQFGKIGFINEEMSVYRRHAGGIWWTAGKGVDETWRRYGIQHLKLYEKLLDMYGDNYKYKRIIKSKILTLLKDIRRIEKEDRSNIFTNAISDAPLSARILIEDLELAVRKLKQHSDRQKKVIDDYYNKNKRLRDITDRLSVRALVKSSKIFKAGSSEGNK